MGHRQHPKLEGRCNFAQSTIRQSAQAPHFSVAGRSGTFFIHHSLVSRASLGLAECPTTASSVGREQASRLRPKTFQSQTYEEALSQVVLSLHLLMDSFLLALSQWTSTTLPTHSSSSSADFSSLAHPHGLFNSRGFSSPSPLRSQFFAPLVAWRAKPG